MPRVLLGAFFMDTQDIFYMKRAISLASKGLGWVNPNPLVGAVVVKNNQIIGEGWHERFGGPHAERNAFKNCTEDARGADLYVTLEPCCHFGKLRHARKLLSVTELREYLWALKTPILLSPAKEFQF